MVFRHVLEYHVNYQHEQGFVFAHVLLGRPTRPVILFSVTFDVSPPLIKRNERHARHAFAPQVAKTGEWRIS